MTITVGQRKTEGSRVVEIEGKWTCNACGESINPPEPPIEQSTFNAMMNAFSDAHKYCGVDKLN